MAYPAPPQSGEWGQLCLAGALLGVHQLLRFYCVDATSALFLQVQYLFPYTAKLCINRHEWAKRQAAKAGISFESLDSGFSSVEDVPRLQAICDSLGLQHIEALLRKWLRILPNPFVLEDEAAGYRYESFLL